MNENFTTIYADFRHHYCEFAKSQIIKLVNHLSTIEGLVFNPAVILSRIYSPGYNIMLPALYLGSTMTLTVSDNLIPHRITFDGVNVGNRYYRFRKELTRAAVGGFPSIESMTLEIHNLYRRYSAKLAKQSNDP